MSSVRRPRGRLFQVGGPAAPKLLSTKLLCVCGTAHMLSTEDRTEGPSVATTAVAVNVLWKETAFSRWRAMDRRWNRSTVSVILIGL